MSLPKLQAGTAALGKFNLPFDASMGNVALPTGDYSFSVSQLAIDGKVFIYQGTKAVVLLRAQMFDPYESQGEKPTLIFIRHNGNATLRALRFPKTGTFYFSLPKELNNLVARQPQLIETVSVEVSGD
jgi:hypothetical protein